MRVGIALLLVMTWPAVQAVNLSCYEDPRTNAHQCFDASNVIERDGIRISPIYTGGPNGVKKTSFTIHVNCKTEVVHLKDRQGVSFAGGYGSETPAIRSLRGWLCAAKLKNQK
jgi:hypothetical protein